MGKYRRIEKLIETSVMEYTNLDIVPRGTPIFPDLLMTGSMRFGRRLGANFSVINPDNQVQLMEAAPASQYQINVSRILPWYEINCLLTFNGIEMMELADYDSTHNIVTMKDVLSTARNQGENLTLWATPLVLHIDATEGDNVIVVRSRYAIVNGDDITIPVSPLLNSLTEFTAVLSSTAGNSGDPDFPYLYSLVIDQPLPIDLTAQMSRIYLRAYPSYVSKTISVSKFSSGQMGPFLLDYLASPLDSVTSYPAVFSTRTTDLSGTPIDGTLSSFKTIQQNYPIRQRPIWAENLLFWKIIRGSGGFIYPNKYRLIADVDGLARVATRIIPTMEPGQAWTFKVTSTSDGLIRLYSEPYGFQDYNLQAHVTQTITLSTPPGGEPLTRIEILAKLDPEDEITIADGIVTGPTVSLFQYAYVFKVLGQTNFQSTSVIMKPYFLALSDLSAQYDEGQQYNSGLIYR